MYVGKRCLVSLTIAIAAQQVDIYLNKDDLY